MGDLKTKFFDSVGLDLTIAEKVNLFHGYVCECGFSDAYYSRMTIDTDGNPKQLVFRHWDPVWRELYERKNYDEVDWVFSAAREQDGPFYFLNPSVELTPRETEFCADAAAHNRMNGFAMPIRDITGLVAGFSATGADDIPTKEQVNEVSSAGLLLDHYVKLLLVQNASKITGVTKREIGIIRHLASGLSMADIARTTSKSDQWIRKSCMQIREKLQVKNNTELVIKASKVSLI